VDRYRMPAILLGNGESQMLSESTDARIFAQVGSDPEGDARRLDRGRGVEG